MNALIPQQVKQLQSFADQRDSLLREIGVYSVERDELLKGNKGLGLSNADLENQIAEKRGVLSILDELEERKRASISADIVELELRKSQLESECIALQEKSTSAYEKYRDISQAMSDLYSTNDVIKNQASVVESMVGDIVETSKTHLSDTKVMMAEMRSVAVEVIEKGNENVAQTGIILDKLPRYIFELQKPIPLRRAYELPRGSVISAPELSIESVQVKE